MRIVISGGTGLIGSEITNRLSRRGHEIILLSRNPEEHNLTLPDRVTAVQWDGKTTSGWGQYVDGAGAVINLAGESLNSGRWTDDRKQRIRASRINAGAALAQAIKQADNPPHVLVQSSAIGYYGPVHDRVVDESHLPGHTFLSDVCVDWEQSTKDVERVGVRRIITRTAMVLSDQGGALPLITLPFRFFIGGKIGSGEQPVPWIHIVDLAEAIIYLMEESSAEGPYNLCAPDMINNTQFTRALAQAMRRPAIFRAPEFALKTVLGEMSSVVLEGQKATPHRLEEAGYQFRYALIGDALRDLLR